MIGKHFPAGGLIAAALSVAGCYEGIGNISGGGVSGSTGASSGAGSDGAASVGPSDSDDGEPQDWEPGPEAGECAVDELLTPHAYGTKVKALLTGLPLEDTELLALGSDDDGIALPTLIDSWMAMPESDAVLERFFRTAFQQTSGNNESLFYLIGVNAFGVAPFRNPTSARADVLLNKNFSDSFAKTALNLVREGRPFNEVLTTETYMMTTAMMMFLAFSDDFIVADEAGYYDQTSRTTVGHFPTVRLLRDPPQPPLEEVIDPSHPNWMTFYSSKISEEISDGCGVGPVITVDTTEQVPGEWEIGRNGKIPFYIFDAIMFGRVEIVRRFQDPECSSGGAGSVNEPLLARSDFTDWRPVSMVKPANGEEATYFYDILNMRGSNELRIHGERLGFLTHPGFLSTWLTNEDNSMRVIINQALIVALGASFDGETVSDFTSEAINQEHAAPGTECYGCHQQLDPMRDFYRASFSNHYSEQLDPLREDLQASFVFGDVEASGSGIRDLADILAEHPYFPYAWAQKLCWYANAEACAEGDELDRVVEAFVASNLDFRVLVRELMSSPLVTGKDCISGTDSGTSTMIARRSTFCQQLSVRLGIDDVCALGIHLEDASSLQRDVARAAASIPDDAFSRAVVEPIVIAETGLFTRANREAVCDIVAQDAFEDTFGAMKQSEVLDYLVAKVMALPPSDARHSAARDILLEHVADAMDTGETEQVALQSAMAVACMSPGASGVGF